MDVSREFCCCHNKSREKLRLDLLSGLKLNNSHRCWFFRDIQARFSTAPYEAFSGKFLIRISIYLSCKVSLIKRSLWEPSPVSISRNIEKCFRPPYLGTLPSMIFFRFFFFSRANCEKGVVRFMLNIRSRYLIYDSAKEKMSSERATLPTWLIASRDILNSMRGEKESERN